MIRALPAPLTIRWRPLFVVGWLAVNVALLFWPVTIVLLVMPHGWMIWVEAPARLLDGRLYDMQPGYLYYYAPAFAALFAPFIPLGYSFWLGLHLAVVPLLRDVRLIALMALSIPFWMDTIEGGLVIFVVVSGLLAIRGSRIGAIAYLALSLLMPRPLQLPLVVWLVWRRPDLRWPFALMTTVLVATTVASGYTITWISELLGLSGTHHSMVANLGPTRLLGPAWLLIGGPLAVWLTTRGRVGLAGLAITPYLAPEYLLLLLWEYIQLPGHRPLDAPD